MVSGTQPPPAVTEPTFKAEIVAADGIARMTIGGTADLIAEPHLQAFLRQTHVYVGQQQVTSVMVDIRALEFMSSSCLRLFVAWALSVARPPYERPYRIVFIVSPTSEWQRRSMSMIPRVAPEIASIEV